eukprot:jgi/Mesvir1/2936/Mv14001-RA.1
MATTSVDPTAKRSTNASGAGGSGSGSEGNFECNICLELAQDPVVTVCGHLFCWPCIYRWLQVHSDYRRCPVCKAGVSEETVIPLYGRGNCDAQDPRTKPPPDVPQRPQGQRPEAVRQPSHDGNAQGRDFFGQPRHAGTWGNFTFHAGIGLFPSLFAVAFSGFPVYNGNPHAQAAPYPPGMRPDLMNPEQQQTFLSRLLLILGCIVMLCLLYF